jgi:hypothetical protein
VLVNLGAMREVSLTCPTVCGVLRQGTASIFSRQNEAGEECQGIEVSWVE